MDGMKQIFNKELARVFKDKKMIFTTFVLPILIMYLIMTLTGNLTKNMVDDIANHRPTVYMVNAPKSFLTYLDAAKIEYKEKALDVDDKNGFEKAKKAVLNGNADLIIDFPKGFEEEIVNYKAGGEIPQVKAYYNPSEEYSSAAYESFLSGGLEGYRQVLLSERIGDISEITIFTVNSDNKEMIIQDEEKAKGKAAGMMLPYFITILLFAGAMGIGTDMIAGEKERGTMASLLVSPVKRSSIALGKVFALMVITGISSLIYVVAMVLFAPHFMGNLGADMGESMKIALTPSQIGMMAALLVSIAFLYSSIIVLFSVFAKSVKEASGYVMPAYMLILVIGLVTMFVSKTPSIKSYFIPIYNNTLALQGVLSRTISPVGFVITLVETLVLGMIIQLFIIKAFNSEKLMSA